MPETKQAVKPFGDLFKETFSIFKKDWSRFAKMILLGIAGIIPFLAVIGLFFVNASLFNNLKILQTVINVILGLAAIASLIFAIYIGVLSQLGTYGLLKDRVSKIMDVFNFGKKNFWGFIWVSLLTGILVMLWTLALIIPGIIFGVYYSLSLYVFIFEEKKGYAAIKRSKELIKNYWWSFVVRMVIFSVIIMITYVILGAILDAPSLAFAKDSAARNGLENISAMLSSLVSSFIISPLFMIFTTLIYKDLVLIKGEKKSEAPAEIVAN